jgi:hypothetical protein
VEEVNELKPVLRAWRPLIRQYKPKVSFGLIAYREYEESYISKPSDQLLTEMDMTLWAGSNGLMIFDLGRLSDNQLSALRSLAPAVPANP